MPKPNLFNAVKMTRPGKNTFDLSHDVKLTTDMGWITPTMCLETVPGDKFNIGCDMLLRFAPMLAPMMHRVDVTMHYFFVPSRLLWSNWDKFITNTLVGGSLPAFPYITLNAANYAASKLYDYMGCPDPGASVYPVNALPFAAYQMVYNEFYRDQNLINEVAFALSDGNNSANTDLIEMRRRAWEHDYFTAALPFAQKGSAVDIPIGNIELDTSSSNAWIVRQSGGALEPSANLGSAPVSATLENLTTNNDVVLDPNGTLITDPVTINDLRRATKLQEWLEKAARGGSRLVESILVHFGVKSSDARLQRPEYITGVKSPVIVSEVLQTGETNTTPQGTMAGHGVSVAQGKYGGYFCEEHGFIIGLMSVMPKTAYQQGLPRMFRKIEDPFQYYWPSFAHIGEQEVLNSEVYAPTPDPNGTFGYVPRYAEYKFMQSRVAGDFKTSALDFWHLGRIFSSAPALNQTFVECTPDDRIFAVTLPGQDNLYCHTLHKIRALRPMPIFGTPTF